MHRGTFVLFSLTALIVACGRRDQGRVDDSIVTTADSPRVSSAALSALPLRALGTEPFWALDIDTAGLRFITPDDTAGSRFAAAAPTTSGDTTMWTGRNEQAIEVRAWPGTCSDGMSDRVYPFAVQVALGGTVYRGCADRRSVIAPR